MCRSALYCVFGSKVTLNNRITNIIACLFFKMHCATIMSSVGLFGRALLPNDRLVRTKWLVSVGQQFGTNNRLVFSPLHWTKYGTIIRHDM